ncbi:MAG: hypothetical protein EON98_00585 [Chitinophagaceae bacterium]|nr:MAG: hypothetical protein EON98_00585 [Chitinophagaceae bacterium]
MNNNQQDPRKKEDNTRSTFETRPDVTPRREGGDDALAETNPSDARLDEKVIVNEQSEQKIVNTPSQTDAHPSETGNTVDEI